MIREHLEIFKPVIGLDVVEVVDLLMTLKEPPNRLLNDMAMFKDVTILARGWMAGNGDIDVAIGSLGPAAFPIRGSGSCDKATCVTMQKSFWLTDDPAFPGAGIWGDLRWLAAAAKTDPAWVRSIA